MTGYQWLLLLGFVTTCLKCCLTGLCHEMNIFLKAYNNKKVLSVHAKFLQLQVNEKSID
jgi:hypothetical protein